MKTTIEDHAIPDELEKLGQMLGELGRDRKSAKLCILAADRLRKLQGFQAKITREAYGEKVVPVRVKPQLHSMGWGSRMMDKGYRVLGRGGPFGRIVFVVKKGDESAQFTQGQDTALNAELPANIAADLREVGAVF